MVNSSTKMSHCAANLVVNSEKNGAIHKVESDETVTDNFLLIDCEAVCMEGELKLRKGAKKMKKVPPKTKWIPTPNYRKNLEANLPLLKRLEPSIRMMQMFGYYRLPYLDVSIWGIPAAKISLVVTTILTAYSTSVIATNLSLFCYNAMGMYSFCMKLGIYHALTVSWIITGLKPFVNFVELSLFFQMARTHESLLYKLQHVDQVFYELTGKRPNVSSINKCSITLLFLSLFIPFFLRVFDIVYKGNSLLGHWLNTVSPVLVPLLTAWGFIPLLHFVAMNRLIRYWFRALSKAIRRDNRLVRHSLADYFNHYKLLTSSLRDFGIFNIFIGFSLAWSVCSVCLAVFFVTQARQLVIIPEEIRADPQAAHKATVNILFNLGWSLLQILVALIFILVITVSGYLTNEEASEVMMDVLSVNPDDATQSDSLQLNYFAHSLNSISVWGISLFRAFPIQRSTVLTMASLMFTYAIVLMRLSPNYGNIENESTTSGPSDYFNNNWTAISFNFSTTSAFGMIYENSSNYLNDTVHLL